MPSRIIHYCVGNELINLLDIDSYVFVMGNLSPDAHGGESKNIGLSHFKGSYQEGIDKYPIADINSYKDIYGSKMNEEFFIGYFCHLITDNMWAREIYSNYLENYEDKKYERIKQCYHDYGVLNKILIERYSLNKIKLDAGLVNFYPEGISKIHLEKVFEGFYKDFESTIEEELSLLSIEFVDSFIKNVTQECINELKMISDTRIFL